MKKRALSTLIAAALVAGAGLFAAPAAQAAGSWHLIQCSPMSYCKEKRQWWQARGYWVSQMREPYPGVGNFDVFY
ncbi:hypothetical protein [Cellulomonas sp. S1-8]|uniref:hypothetical protein n=1 Tax=Cellulomonas sp. S1-8 TaxID=2904790 RepID=UPI0022430C75|nr:hypothetical protein [Cellulomonas sp. S1-8]UZN03245.1 hypothetical protein OKX07_19700 [Cellulomonas sp. S1-8]